MEAPLQPRWVKEVRFFSVALAAVSSLIFFLGWLFSRAVTWPVYFQTALVALLVIYIVRAIGLILKNLK